MASIILVPYNDSMRLGQGYNSFMQTPCIHNAVDVGDPYDLAEDYGQNGIPQIVSYSSRFVNKISEVVRSMNISAGTSIKNGTITVSGNSLNVDELKFSTSDLNAVVSVKVVNQQTTLRDDAQFVPPKRNMSSEKFHEIYGDSYISGYITGGDLHGVVSIKVLDASKKEQVKSLLKGQINGSGSKEFTLTRGGGSSSISNALKQTETTISVNWSGGGQIKSEGEEWTFESLMRAAAAFPAKVASCPQRTYAILTRYDNNVHFLPYARSNRIKIRDYSGAQRYSSDLLDMFMEYKNNLATIQGTLSDPNAYRVSSVAGALSISVKALVDERKAVKQEMALILSEIEQINRDPALVAAVEAKSKIQPPEVWATRLPILKAENTKQDFLTTATSNILAGFPLVGGSTPITEKQTGPPPAPPAPVVDQVKEAIGNVTDTVKEIPVIVNHPKSPYEPPPPPFLYSSANVGPHLNLAERTFLDSMDNRKKYRRYRFDSPQGTVDEGVLGFNDAEVLEQVSIPATWPTRFEINLVSWESSSIIGLLRLIYDQTHLERGSPRGRVVQALVIDLAPGEKIIKLRMCTGNKIWGVNGISYMEVLTSAGNQYTIGSPNGGVVDLVPYDGAVGLKGFFGRTGDVVDRIGPVWGFEQ